MEFQEKHKPTLTLCMITYKCNVKKCFKWLYGDLSVFPTLCCSLIYITCKLFQFRTILQIAIQLRTSFKSCCPTAHIIIFIVTVHAARLILIIIAAAQCTVAYYIILLYYYYAFLFKSANGYQIDTRLPCNKRRVHSNVNIIIRFDWFEYPIHYSDTS